ncbi:MAG TPA: SMP-30/gluconolactonase/LRE family protein, partial [Flavisolibacter sp.]|nr:SMP-30/gluconolactonase/LRE family protein [Flavisolibacter sp.]
FQLKGYSQQKTAADFLPANAIVKEIFSAGEEFLEGVTMSPDGLLYFSDFPNFEGAPHKAGIIWTLDPKTGESRVFRSPSGMSNGMKFDANGDLVICEGGNFGGRSIVRTDFKTGKSYILAGLYNGKRFNSPNDLTIDEKGRIYFTDPRYLGPETIEQNGMNVYRIDTNGTVHLAAANIAKPNGVVLSPDQKTLYVANNDYPGNGRAGFSFEANAVRPSGEGSVYAYDVKPDGSLQFRSVLISYGSKGGPDGMTVDRDGNLYVALGNRVSIHTPDGKWVTDIQCPRATNLCFGRGPFRNTLFIAGGKSVYQVETKKEGYLLPLANH